MLIGEFARTAGVSVDTVRFYIRKGLLDPEAGRLGGRNPYRIFTNSHVEAIRLLRLAQSFGMSLRQLAILKREFDAHGLSREREIEITRTRLSDLEQKLDSLGSLVIYLRERVDWLESGECGPKPMLLGSGSDATRNASRRAARA